MNNPEKLAIQGTQDPEKLNKHTSQCTGHHHTQTHTNNTNKK